MGPKTKRIYLDNAATTKLDDAVLNVMLPFLWDTYGNPSSSHFIGREARIAVEEARKKIASLVSVKPNTIIFTSGATESNNMAIRSALRDFGCNHIITSKIEHHAVLHPVEYYAQEFNAGISYVRLYEDGSINQNELRRLLEMNTEKGQKCLVTLMHANNEIGQFTEIRWVSNLCKRHGAIFHSDCVQTIGHYPVNLRAEGVHMASASAHKFHGSKGVGFLYVREDLNPSPLIIGGKQEREYRAGTENVGSIIGMAQALHLSYKHYQVDQLHISELKQYLATQLKANFPGIIFNSSRHSLYSLLSVSFPKNEKSEMLLLELDQKGICVSGGSACSGGNSHVMEALGRTENYVTVRFSLSKNNSKDDINTVVEALKEILQPSLIMSSTE